MNRPGETEARPTKGFYVDVQVGAQVFESLVDTGASASVLAWKTYEKLVQDEEVKKGGFLSDLEQATHSLHGPGGQKLKVYGMVNLEFDFGGVRVKQRFTVTDMGPSVVLGWDFLSSHGIILDVARGQIIMRPPVTQPGDRQVVADATYVLPARGEMVIMGEYKGGEKVNSDTWMIEMGEQLPADSALVVAPSLCRATTEGIPIRITNASHCPQVVRKGDPIATWEVVMVSEDQELAAKDITEQMENRTSPENAEREGECLGPTTQAMLDRAYEGLDEEQKEKLRQVIYEYRDRFAEDRFDLGVYALDFPAIRVKDDQPVHCQPRRFPPEKREAIENEVRALLKAGIIRECDTPYSNPVCLVRKPDGSWRMCLDLRRLNEKVIRDQFPLPDLTSCLDAMSGMTYFSSMDLCQGFLQLSLLPEDQEKTGFRTESGSYCYTRLVFGCANSPAIFSRCMAKLFAGMASDKLTKYCDDLCVHSRTFDGHLDNLRECLDILRRSNLKLAAKKCQLCRRRLSFLGHTIDGDGVSTCKQKTAALETWPQPRNLKEVRGLLGFFGFYRRFVRGFSDIAFPMTRLTRKGVPFQWSDACEEAKQKLTKILTSSPVLRMPKDGRKYPFTLSCDASTTGIGGVLAQEVEGQERPIAYFSQTLAKPQTQYCATRLELLSLTRSIKHFNKFLYGIFFVVYSDHSSLRWIAFFRNLCSDPQLSRILNFLAMYDFELRHRPGTQMAHADGLSRRPRSIPGALEALPDRPCLEDCTYCNRKEKQFLEEYQKQIHNPEEEEDTEEVEDIPDEGGWDFDTTENTQEEGGASLAKIEPHPLGCRRNSDENGIALAETKVGELMNSDEPLGGDQLTGCQLLKEEDVSHNQQDEGAAAAEGRQGQEAVLAVSRIEADEEEACLSSWAPKYSHEDLEKMQKEDPVLGVVRKWVEDKDRPPYDEVKTLDPALRHLWIQYPSLTIWDGMLCRLPLKHATAQPPRQILAPESLRPEIFQVLHNDRTANHPGRHRMADFLSQRFYWPGWSQDIIRFLASCEVCQFTTGKPGFKRHPINGTPASAPMEYLQIDLLRMPRPSADNYQYVLVCTCMFTGYKWGFPLKSKDSREVADKLLYGLWLPWGPFQHCYSDLGREFVNTTLEQICEVLGIRKTHSVGYTPKSTGGVERANQTLLNALLKLSHRDPELDWPAGVQIALSAANNTPASNTGLAPAHLLFGRVHFLPADLLLPSGKAKPTALCSSSYAEELRKDLQEVHQSVRQVLEKNRTAQARFYNRRAKFHTYKRGDYVLRYCFTRTKLTPKWQGPFRVQIKYHDLCYGISMAGNNRIYKAHPDHIKRYDCGNKDPGIPLLDLETEEAEKDQNAERNKATQEVDEGEGETTVSDDEEEETAPTTHTRTRQIRPPRRLDL